MCLDCETSGYPLGHKLYELRTIQLGGEEAAVVYNASARYGDRRPGAAHRRGEAARPLGQDDRIELSARIEDEHVILTVADYGCGIPEADLERIFGRFFRATPYRSREVGGFGLGLPTVAAIAEAHHGSVRVNSTVGKGSTFELLIPAGPAANGKTGLGGPVTAPEADAS